MARFNIIKAKQGKAWFYDIVQKNLEHLMLTDSLSCFVDVSSRNVQFSMRINNQKN